MFRVKMRIKAHCLLPNKLNKTKSKQNNKNKQKSKSKNEEVDKTKETSNAKKCPQGQWCSDAV